MCRSKCRCSPSPSCAASIRRSAPEMKSTGEVMGRDRNYAKALYKGLIGAGMKIPPTGAIIATIADKDKEEAIEMLERLLRARLQDHRDRRNRRLRWSKRA